MEHAHCMLGMRIACWIPKATHTHTHNILKAQEYTDNSTIWSMRIACWIPKATHTRTHTHTICNIYCFSTATMVAR